MGNPAAPDLVVVDFWLDYTTLGDHGTYQYHYVIGNIGDARAPNSATRLYISTDANITSADTILHTDWFTWGVDPDDTTGQIDVYTFSLDLASLGLAPGNYFVGLIADANNAIAEADETNNVSNVIEVRVVPGQADIAVTDLTLSSTTLVDGGTYSFNYIIENTGTTNVISSSSRLYLSSDPNAADRDRPLSAGIDTGLMYPGMVATQGSANTFTLDFDAMGLTPGTYYVTAVADRFNVINEVDELNNLFVVEVTLQGSPDLQVGLLYADSPDFDIWTDGDEISLYCEIENWGQASSGSFTSGLYISTDATITTDDILLYSEQVSSSIIPGGYIALEGTVNAFTLDFAALDLTPGTYYVGMIADIYGQVIEEDETNNVSDVIQVTLQDPPLPPDLIVTDLTLNSTTWVEGGSYNFYYNVENIGGLPASDVRSRLYISTDATITTDDMVLSIDNVVGNSAGVVNPGYVYAEGEPNSITLFSTLLDSLGLTPGTYYVGAIVDVDNVVAEYDETNNVSNVIQVTIQGSGGVPGGNGDAPRHDFNGDAISDILWHNTTTGQIGMYAMDSDGTASWQGISYASNVWDIVGTGDFNGDATDDILFRHTANGRIGMYAMDNGAATWQGIASPAQVWATVGTGDFNGDGTDDILWRHTTTGQVGMYAMDNGAATWQGIATPAQVWATVGTGDFNGDGTDDILWRHTTTGEVGMYAMNNGAATWQSIATPSHVWDIVGTGDFNGDGTDDILFRHTNNNSVGMYVMDNGNPTWQAIGNPALAWSVEGQDVDSFHFV